MLMAYSSLSKNNIKMKFPFNLQKFPLIDLDVPPEKEDTQESFNYFDIAAAFIENEEDITRSIYDYLKYRHKEGAIYVELPCSFFPRTVEDRPNFKSVSSMIRAVSKGIENAKKQFGIEANIIVVLLRRFGHISCSLMLRDIFPEVQKPRSHIVGIAITGNETDPSIVEFIDGMIISKAWHLGVVVHERANVIEEMLKHLRTIEPNRIRCDIDFLDSHLSLMQDLNIGLAISPTLNTTATLNVNSPHTLKSKLRTHQYAFILRSDKEASLLQKQWEFSLEEMIENCKKSLEMSFIDTMTKNKLLCYINFYAAFHCFRNYLLSNEHYHSTSCTHKIEEFLKTPSYNGFQEIQDLAVRDLPKNKVLTDFCESHQRFQAYLAEADLDLKDISLAKAVRFAI